MSHAGNKPIPLTDEERATYEWQMWVRGFGERGQERLKGATALVSRVGGLGGVVAQQLAAAGIGRLILAHRGNLKPSDLNRQTLMTHESLGHPRVETARRRLLEFNPRLHIEAVPENLSDANAAALVGRADIVFDCAPRFSERYAMNRECVRQRKPLVEAAMFNLEGRVTLILPGQTPCLRCLYPDEPPQWKREFPVFAAVCGTVGSIAAMEGIKLLAGMPTSLAGSMLEVDLETMAFHRVALARRPGCVQCGSLR